MSDTDIINTIIAEAGNSERGMTAAAYTILNRSTHRGLTPSQVVKQHGQYKGYSSPGPASKEAQKMASVRAKAEKVWQAVQARSVPDPTKGGFDFRSDAAAKGLHAPHGTVSIDGNTYALGKGALKAPQTALAAINNVAPLPAPKPLVAQGYANSPAGTPRTAPMGANAPTVKPPSAPGLLNLRPDAMNGVRLPASPQKARALDAQPMPSLDAMTQAIRQAGSGAVSSQMQRMIAPQVPSAPSTRSVPTIAIRANSPSGFDQPGGGPSQAGYDLLQRAAAESAPPKLPPPKVTFYAKDQIAREDAARLGDLVGRMAGTPTPKPPAVAQTYQPGMLGRSSAPPTPLQRNANDIVTSVPPTRTAQNYTDAANPLDNQYLGLTLSPPVAPGVAAINGATVPLPRVRPPTPQAPASIPLTSINPSHGQVTIGPDGNKYQYVQKTGGVGGTADTSGSPTWGWTRLGASVPTVPVPSYRASASMPLSSFGTVNPMSQIMPGMGAYFNTTPVGHLTQLATGQPIQGGLLGMLFNRGGLFGGLTGGAPQAPRLQSGPPPAPAGTSYLNAAGIDTSGMTSGQIANELNKQLAGSSRNSDGTRGFGV